MVDQKSDEDLIVLLDDEVFLSAERLGHAIKNHDKSHLKVGRKDAEVFEVSQKHERSCKDEPSNQWDKGFKENKAVVGFVPVLFKQFAELFDVVFVSYFKSVGLQEDHHEDWQADYNK